MPLKKTKQAALDRWEAKRQAEAPPEPQFEMEIELEEAASDELETVEAMVATWDGDDKIMDELHTQFMVSMLGGMCVRVVWQRRRRQGSMLNWRQTKHRPNFRAGDAAQTA